MSAIIKHFGKAFQSTKKTSSIFTSIIQVITIVSFLLCTSIVKGYFFVSYFIFSLLCLCILVYLGVFIYFSIKDPSRLHKEEHIENIAALNSHHQIFIRKENGIEVKQIKNEANVPNPLIISGEKQ